jgi:cytochrome c biogenesis protein CcmG/thiol:disulfide interchange protein DsbE
VKSRALPVVAALAGAGLIALLIYGVSQQAASRTLDERVASRQYPPAPDASTLLPVLGGHGLSSLGSLRGKIVVLNFWASWCQPCEQEAPLLEHTQTQLQRDRGTVLGVTYKDATPDSRSFVERYHLSYPNLRDNTGAFAGSYGTDQLPESFIINRDGHIVAISRGEIDERFLNHALALAKSA